MSKFIIPRAADRAIIDCINNAPFSDNSKEVIAITPFAERGAGSLSIDQFKENSVVKELLERRSFLIDRFTISLGKFTINYQRGGIMPFKVII